MKAGIKKRGKKEPTPASQEVAILVCEEGRHIERKKWHMLENLLTYCFLALLQCLGRDVGAVNGFCSNVIIWFFRKMKKFYFG